MTLEEKLYEIEKIKIRKSYVEEFLEKSKYNVITVNAGTKVFFLNKEDEELKKLIREYYTKELEKANERLNKLLK